MLKQALKYRFGSTVLKENQEQTVILIFLVFGQSVTTIFPTDSNRPLSYPLPVLVPFYPNVLVYPTLIVKIKNSTQENFCTVCVDQSVGCEPRINQDKLCRLENFYSSDTPDQGRTADFYAYSVPSKIMLYEKAVHLLVLSWYKLMVILHVRTDMVKVLILARQSNLILRNMHLRYAGFRYGALLLSRV